MKRRNIYLEELERIRLTKENKELKKLLKIKIK